MYGCHMPKQSVIAMVCDSKLHAILWCVINMKLNIGKKITGLEIMILNHEKTDVWGGVTLFTGMI